jgi:tetratricopeptide (TPR) repeat protein
LECYKKALAAARKSLGGKLPAKLAWDEHGKPALRAIHGLGLNHFRKGEFKQAAGFFEELLRLNPADNQGAHFLLEDAKKKKHLWKGDDASV